MNIEELKEVLKFHNELPFITTQLIIDYCESIKIDIKVSYTGENEILIFIQDTHKNYHNLLIDDDNDMWYMFIGDNREDTYIKSIGQPYDIANIINAYFIK